MAEFESIYKGGDDIEEIKVKLRDLEAQIAANNPRNIAGMREKELRALTRANMFGDGSDGSATLDGTTDFNDWSSRSGTTYTLTRDVFLSDLTLKSGVTLKGGGFYLYVKDDLVNRGTIHANGGDGGAGGNGIASGGAGGTAGAAAYTGTTTLPPVLAGAAGNIGGYNGSGGAGFAGTNDTHCLSNDGVAGGAGGDGSTAPGEAGGAGGAAGTVTGVSRYPKTQIFATLMNDYDGSPYATAASSGGGGGGGSASSSDGGGGGGGSGAPGGFLWVSAARIINEGTISANGGAGGAGGNGYDEWGGGGGGGGGGTGGVVILIYGIKSGAGTETVAGGAGGAGGTGGTQSVTEDGIAGTTGNDGVIYEIELG